MIPSTPPSQESGKTLRRRGDFEPANRHTVRPANPPSHPGERSQPSASTVMRVFRDTQSADLSNMIFPTTRKGDTACGGH
jgi:hypothetical protein